MSRRLALLVNPAAAGGKALAAVDPARTELDRLGADFRVIETSSGEHAKREAKAAAGQGETPVAIGGDGLVGTLAGGIAGSEAELGIIPAGRGNDFARMLGIPADPARAAAALLRGGHRMVDLIGAAAGDGPEQVVAGSVYLGIPADGAQLAAASRLPPGGLGYQVAGLRALLAWEPTAFTVDTGSVETRAMFTGCCVVVANSGYFAGGMHAAPGADVSDGLLDVITVRQGSKLSFIRVMLLAGRGQHTRLDQVGTAQAASVTVRADRDLRAGADGEPLPCASPLASGIPLRIRALRGALRVVGREPSPR